MPLAAPASLPCVRAGAATPPLQEPMDRNDTSIAVPHRTGGMVLMNPLNEPGGARGARRRNSGSETMPPKKSRSPVSFGIFSKRNRGDVLFCGMPCEPGTPLEAPPCATRPPPARPARNGGSLSLAIFQRAGGRGPVYCGFSGCFALVLRVRADMPRRGRGSAIVTSFLFECTWRGAPPPQAVPLPGA